MLEALRELTSKDEPGTACAVRLNGDLVWEGAAGFSDLESKIPMTASRKFCVFSITKTFTAAACLRIRSATHLSLDESIERWFPSLPSAMSITLRHLFRHSSGLRDYGSLQSYYDAVRSHPSSPWTEEEYLADTLQRGLLFAPGSSWAYSNVGYLLLKRVLEMETGCSLKECLDAHVFRPLSLSGTFVAETIADWNPCVPGYSRDFTGSDLQDVRPIYHPGWCAPGVAVSTTQDVAAFFDALFAGGFLSDGDRGDLLDLVDVPGKHPPAVRPSYGLGIMADPEGPCGASYGHGGEGPGFSVSATVLPFFDKGCLSVALFQNGSYGRIAGKTLHALLPHVISTVRSSV